MAKRVVVIASGETERRALPQLAAHLGAEGTLVESVLIPPRNKALDVEMAHKLVSAAWFKAAVPPDKFVVLFDADGREPDRVLQPFRQSLPPRLHRNITAPLQLAVAQWHLEAWYFADAVNLRSYLGRATGADIANPDEIPNPKLRLKHLLGNCVYTAAVAEEIARVLDPAVIARRSPSFQRFIAAVKNGPTPVSGLPIEQQTAVQTT
ncbi:MAG TPA: DUF4276 family protein [Pirellulales bacterium]|nr:DUF4276 family protein [Pirellulales bacterium]